MAEKLLKYYKYVGENSGLVGQMKLAQATLVPSTKEFAAIYLIPKIANNEQVQKVPDNLLKLLNAKLEDWINDVGKKEQKK